MTIIVHKASRTIETDLWKEQWSRTMGKQAKLYRDLQSRGIYATALLTGQHATPMRSIRAVSSLPADYLTAHPLQSKSRVLISSVALPPSGGSIVSSTWCAVGENATCGVWSGEIGCPRNRG